MKSSRKRLEKRKFFDVVERDSWILLKKIRKYFGWEDVLNLRPPFYRRYPFRVATIILLAVFIVFSGRYIFIRAESATLYPGSCLGAWENSQRAEGQPESLSSSTVFVDQSNAARYPGENKKIFCGKFLPDDFSLRGKLESAALTLVFQLGTSSMPIGQQGIVSTSSVLEDNTPASSSELIPEPDLPKELEMSPTSTTSENEPVSFWNYFLPPVFAQEEVIPAENSLPSPQTEIFPITAPIPEENLTPAPPPVVSPAPPENPIETSVSNSEESVEKIIELGPPIVASIEEVSSTETIASGTIVDLENVSTTASSNEIVVSPPVIDQNFLQISYSIDGENWNTIGRINKQNWNLYTVPIPVNSWEEVDRLQVAIEVISTTETDIPEILLDGMFLGIEYENSIIDEMIDKSEESKAPKPLRTFPSADPARLEAAEQKIKSLFPEKIIISQQFESGNRIIFKGGIDENNQIYLLDAVTEEIKTLTANQNFKSEPAIYGEYATWAESNGQGLYGEIMLYSFQDNLLSRLTDDKFTDHLPYFESGLLVWNKLDAEAQNHVYLYDFDSKTITQKDTLPFLDEPLPENQNNE